MHSYKIHTNFVIIAIMDVEKYSAAIFRRGQKQELFGDDDDNHGQLELEYKLDELLDIWSLPREG
jgi:hypothetical protein